MSEGIIVPSNKKIYFASDFHLGSFPLEDSTRREARIVEWLESIRQDAFELYLMGDVFDFWFEYKTVVPKGFIRFLGKLAQLADEGVKIYIFKGNHDMWMFDYLEVQLGATIISDELVITRNGKTFYLHHGDGLGPGDYKYKFLKRVFRNKVCQWLFARLHPNLGIGIAQRWSRHSRITSGKEEKYLGADKEWLVLYAQEMLHEHHVDYFIFGHRHLALDLPLQGGSRYLNLGEWIFHPTYAVFDGSELSLLTWPGPKSESLAQP